MKQKKSLQELTFKDNFMFGAVMLDPENCKGILERSLGVEIERVEVSKEKSIVYNPEYKGVRLDVYAKDENNTHYDVEMQVLRKPAVKKRARYYHGQLDMEILLSGLPYEDLPDTYVIFICDYDPFGKGKYRYTQQKICEEEPELSMEDGAHTVFLSTKGTNVNEVPPELVRFLKFVEAPLSDSDKDFEDDFIRRLQSSVRKVKESREMGARYMTFQELLKDERMEERSQMIIELLEELGAVPENLQMKIMQEKNSDTLRKWCRLAAKAESVEQFENEITEE
ncbi:MAG: Rpn family recombination-promoting nuclease/putative transposase [Tyzzerella sp.]|nr:Rpn family recombination-promoting nuclease/putative transposase [Tyzzerella sp.]